MRLLSRLSSNGVGRIVTLSGRYYAMDRDRRWDRVKRAYDVMTQDGPGDGRSVIEVLQDSYAEKVTDSSSSQSGLPRT